MAKNSDLNRAIPAQLPQNRSEQDQQTENNQNLDYDEPNCQWSPTRKTDDDCGEGIIFPPCG